MPRRTAMQLRKLLLPKTSLDILVMFSIASQGWVKTSGGDKYVVTTKASETAGRDGKADIIVSAIKVTQTGVKNPLLDAKFTKVKDGKTPCRGAHHGAVRRSEHPDPWGLHRPESPACHPS